MGGEGKVVKKDQTLCITQSVMKKRNLALIFYSEDKTGADLGGGCRGCAPLPPEMTRGFLIQLVFCQKKNYVVYWC